MAFALDFGTSNTVLAWRDEAGRLQSWRFDYENANYDTYRSILYMEPAETARGVKLDDWAGPAAMAEYGRYGESGRLLQSLKSHLASPAFTGTQIFSTSFTLEQLIARFLNRLRQDAAASGLDLGHRLTVGRPVRFVGADADEALAIDRLQRAFAQAGFTDCNLVPEPIAAAYEFARRTTEPGRVLIADMGGGTSDFAIVEIVTPGDRPELRVIATGGVGIAGDDLDAAIIDHVVAPQLGRDALLQSGQHVPRWLYDYVRRWHHLSFLRTPQVKRELQQLTSEAVDPQPLRLLQALIEQNQGFGLAQAVAAAKRDLSAADQATFSFTLDGQTITADISRADFEVWIAPLLQRLGDALGETLNSAGLGAGDIRHVFMTGGTSYVPAINRLFAETFSAATLHRGDELTSVAAGLAMQPGSEA